MTLDPSADADSPDDPRRLAAVEFLLERANFERLAVMPYGERRLKLDRMRTLLRKLGQPDVGLPVVHIAGTKGKGSVSAVLAALLGEAGYCVGVFSSPHLARLEERWVVDGQRCPGSELATLVDLLRPVVAEMERDAETHRDPSRRPTFFELCTALAWLQFMRRGVDLVVMEVGLGGRLDSTNVCQPTVTAVTSISRDHTRQLGETLEEIAFEKGGIIKPGVPVVVGPMASGPLQVLRGIAQERGSPLLEAEHGYRFAYEPPEQLTPEGAAGSVSVWGLDDGDAAVAINAAPLGMIGRHQAANAAIAVALAAELRRQQWQIPTEAIRRGLAKARLAGRVETVNRRPTVLLDVAHNVASAQALADCLTESFAPSRRILLFSCAKDKEPENLLAALVPRFDKIVLTQFQDNPRAVPAADLAEHCRRLWRQMGRQDFSSAVLVEPRPIDAWRSARGLAEPTDLICITGSFFLIGELRDLVGAEAAGSTGVAAIA